MNSIEKEIEKNSIGHGLSLNTIYNMDCLEGMRLIPDNSIDSIVTDPPYEIGFMGKGRDNTGIANSVEMRSECLRILKPGGHLLSFAATRTYHRMACAIEDAGFEVRDMIEWVYGSGFPKSLNIGKAVDKLQGNEMEFTGYDTSTAPDLRDVGAMSKESTGIDKLSFGQNPRPADRKQIEITKGVSAREGRGTALKPAHEPICMARKPLEEKTVAENVLKYGTGGINIDDSRVEGTYDNEGRNIRQEDYKSEAEFLTALSKEGRKTRSDSNSLGRFPANLIHDNSEEVRECFPDNIKGEIGRAGRKSGGNYEASSYKVGVVTENGFKDNGSASRFFKSIIYQAKASKSERNNGCEGLEEKATVFNGQSNKPSEDMKDVEKIFTTLPKANNHPTVKSLPLMEYLIKMVTKPGGVVLDPFAGSGTTLVAAKKNGYQYIGCELTAEYIPIIEARLQAEKQYPDNTLFS